MNLREVEKLIKECQQKQSSSLVLMDLGISYVPKSIGTLKYLVHLHIHGTKLTEKSFPDELSLLTNLVELHIHGTNIQEVPHFVYSLTNLRILCLHSNKIEKFNESILKLVNLERLVLKRNQIKELPAFLGDLISLETLSLERNLISTVPEELFKLKKLKKINISENLLSIPEEIFSSSAKMALQYIFDIQNNKENSAPMCEAKLIFIGFGGVGKTSLIKMLVHNKFDQNQLKTEGIEIKDWNTNIKGKNIKWHIWDFGGQEIMHATHRFFMTQRTAYILVVDTRTEDKYGESGIEYWLKLISSYANKNVPIIVVVNKCETHKIDISKNSLQEKYPNIVGFVETSCVTKAGIRDLKNKIIQAAEEKLSDHIYNLIPLSYFKIKAELQKINEDYISLSAYKDLCLSIDAEIDETRMENLLELLHDLGIMLSFFKDRHLQQTNVLNPEWVTQGVYKIINSPTLIEKKGIITISDAEQILSKDKNYCKKENCYYIMDIMKIFEISFQIECEKDKYFIPGAFPKDKPSEIIWDYPKNKLLRFRYDYDVMPSSIMSRFIVKSYNSIKSNQFWRNGVVLEIENCLALVKADPSDKFILIEIYSEEAQKQTKRDTLAFIRNIFSQMIHKTLGDIKVKQSIPYILNGDKEVLLDYDSLLFHEESGEEKMLIASVRAKVDVSTVLNGVISSKARKEEQKAATHGIEISSITAEKIIIADTIKNLKS